MRKDKEIKNINYDHKKIEKKWSKFWAENKIYKTLDNKTAIKNKIKPYYVLDMFPYPSGAGLHVGHPRGYIGSDVYARYKRMQGFNVLHPMGFDAFGLPAEQYAISTGKHPSIITDIAIKKYKDQLNKIGFSYDWDRQVITKDPQYYKWTQFIFLKIYNSYFDNKKQKSFPIENLISIFEKSGNKNIDVACSSGVFIFDKNDWKSFSKKEKQDVLMKYRLVYEGYAEVNWCKELGTVLANDEIVEKDGKVFSERGNYPVEKKSMRQWFMRITAYGDRLIKGLDDVDFENSTKEVQKNWIGKSIGSEIEFKIKDFDKKIKIFTTRADTLFGATYIVLAPEHNLVQDLLPKIQNQKEVLDYVEKIKNKTPEERQNNKNKTGVELKGVKAINPANGQEIPIWIADYVLVSYGTGAVMAVPAHDERDYDFAKNYNLEIKQVIISPEDLFIDYGILKNSDQFSGMYSEEAKEKITKFVGGKIVTNYKMRDAIFARQRYWGEPIPLIHDKNGIITEVKEKDLPLELPKVTSYKPSGNGESPLSGVKSWVSAGYETNTMPGWAGSSWYFLRYMDTDNNKNLAGEDALKYWKNVDVYVGGTEHNTGHLLYARFWNKVLFDLGIAKTNEPFKKLRHQGMIGGPDGRKMSKRWGNVINPDDIVDTYGADTLRVYEMFLGPFDSHLPWNTESIMGSRRFIERIWKAYLNVINNEHQKTETDILYALQDLIKKVESDIVEFKFNTAISSMMIFIGLVEDKNYQIDINDFIKFVKILAPFAPYVVEEIISNINQKNDKKIKSIHLDIWPKIVKLKERKLMQNIIVQFNGKLRGNVLVDPDTKEEEIISLIQKDEKLNKYFTGSIIKTIFIQNKLINFVIKV